jgi:hypothetical protein
VAPSGATITNYVWTFGPPNTVIETGGPIHTHPFPSANVYQITLQITFSDGGNATTSQFLTIQ